MKMIDQVQEWVAWARKPLETELKVKPTGLEAGLKMSLQS